jgi:hypothetical protein
MTKKRKDEFGRVNDLFEGLPDARPEAREAARAALVARFEATEDRSARPVRRGWLGARFVIAAAGCATALVVATIFITSSDVATKAYAVQPQPSGLVIVFVNSLEDGEGLQQSLRDAGVPAVVEFNDRSDLPALRGRPEFPPGFRNIVPSRHRSIGVCTARLPAPVKVPGSDVTVETVELPYPESLGHLADLDPSLQPTLQTSFEEVKENTLRELKQTLSPAGFRRVLKLTNKSQQYPGARTEAARAEKLGVPPFTFVPTEDLVPPTEEEGVTFIIDPRGLGAGESLHIVTTGGGLQSMTAYTRNAICTANGESK